MQINESDEQNGSSSPLLTSEEQRGREPFLPQLRWAGAKLFLLSAGGLRLRDCSIGFVRRSCCFCGDIASNPALEWKSSKLWRDNRGWYLTPKT